MESPILRLKKKKSPNLFILQKTKTILEEDVVPHAEWEIIKKWYSDIENHPDVNWIDKAMNSIINSIVHQRRAVFALSRDGVRSVLASDKNWSQPIGLKNDSYKFLLASLIDAGILEPVGDRGRKKLAVYKVVDQNILEMIKVNSPEEQLAEVLDFVDKNDENDEGTQKGTQKGTQRVREIESKRVSSSLGTLSFSEENEQEDLAQDKSEDINKISFEELLFAQHPDSMPSFDDISFLAQLAIENCGLVEVDTYVSRVLEKHLKMLCRNKPTSKQKAWIEKLINSFEFEANKILSLRKIQNISLKEPEELKSVAIKKNIDEELAIQNNTLNALKTSFGLQEIKTLREALKHATDERQAAIITHEIELLESIL
jgi:hypothetical protein